MGSLRQVLAQLHGEGLNAKIVDAIDGDAFTSQARLVLNFSKLSRCAARRTNSCYRVVLQSTRLARRKLRSCFAAVAFESNISEKNRNTKQSARRRLQSIWIRAGPGSTSLGSDSSTVSRGKGLNLSSCVQ